MRTNEKKTEKERERERERERESSLYEKKDDVGPRGWGAPAS